MTDDSPLAGLRREYDAIARRLDTVGNATTAGAEREQGCGGSGDGKEEARPSARLPLRVRPRHS